MPTAYSYIRFSTKQQSEGDSERRQMLKSQDYCMKNNLTLSDKSYSDLGISAFKEISRPSLSDMLDAIESNYIKDGDYIILENLDRLSRKGISDTQDVIKAIIKSGVNIVSLQDGLELKKGSENDLVSVIRIAVSADLAYQESAKKSDRLKAVWAKKQIDASKDKTPKTTKCPAWLQLSEDRTKYEIVSEKVKVIKDIFEMLSNGIGKKSVASLLNKESRVHISNLKRTTGIWYPSYIDKISTSLAVLGHFVPTTEREGKRVLDFDNKIEDYFPRVIEDELFYRVRKVRALNTSRQGRKGVAFTNLLQGFSFCGACGNSMQFVNKGNGDVYLRCSKFLIGLCNNSKYFRYRLFEFAVLDLMSSNDFKKHLENPSPTDFSSNINKITLEIEKRKDELNYYLNQEPTSVMREKITATNNKLFSLEKELNEVEMQEVNEKLLTLETEADFSELVSDIVIGDILIRSKVNSYLKRRCKLEFDAEGKKVTLSLRIDFIKNSVKYLHLARLFQNENSLMALTKSEDEDNILEFVENGKIVTKIP